MIASLFYHVQGHQSYVHGNQVALYLVLTSRDESPRARFHQLGLGTPVIWTMFANVALGALLVLVLNR